MIPATTDRDERPGISAVLPAHNQCTSLEGTILDVAAVLDGLVGSAFEIVVVDDGSTDDTPRLLADLALRRQHLPLRVIRHERARGFAASLASGFDSAQYDLLFCTAVDGQFDVYELDRLLDALDESADLVIGYREQSGDGALARLKGWGWNLLVRALFGATVRDVDSPFKLLRRTVWQQAAVRSAGPVFSVELLVRARQHGFRLRDVPLRHRRVARGVTAHAPRAAEPSPLGWALLELMRLRRELGVPLGEHPASVAIGRRAA